MAKPTEPILLAQIMARVMCIGTIAQRMEGLIATSTCAANMKNIKGCIRIINNTQKEINELWKNYNDVSI